uniref:Uncharacterized protein n=1 Tax=Sus scrofa TaxID=9823 RepID=A0A8D1IW54_PIG
RRILSKGRFYPKGERGKKTKQNPGQNQKGGFHSSFHKLFAKKSNGSEHKEKTNENSPVDPLHTHTISLETDLLLQMNPMKKQLCKAHFKLNCQVVR